MGGEREMKRFPKPCRICGVLSPKPLCQTHLAQSRAVHEQRRALRKAETKQYSNGYKKRAKLIRDTAIVCHICGEGRRMNDPFEADHVIPATPGDSALLLPAHRTCNRLKSNKPII